MPDREKVIKAIEDCVFHKNDCVDCYYDGCVFEHGDCRRDMLADALELLKEQPEIVRCKDCKGSTDFTDDPKLRGWKCRWHGGFHGGDWYCADGERKDSNAQ